MKVNDKVIFNGVRPLWFTDIIDNAKNNLKADDTYTVSSLKEFSSYSIITLKETGDLEYNHAWFTPLWQPDPWQI